MKEKIKKIILTLIVIFFILFLSSIIITQDYNPTLTSEQQTQLVEYRAVLVEEYIKPLELSIEENGYTIDAYKGLIDWLDETATQSRNMYSPIESPFNKMVANSSNEKYFTATADKSAKPDIHPLEILQVAKADELISEPITKDLKLEPAEFTIISGEKERTVKFNGGNIMALERALNRYGEDVFEARNIRIDLENYRLLLRGLQTGERNKLIFFGDVSPLQKIGMLYGGSVEEEDIEIEEEDEETEEEAEEEAEEEKDTGLINSNSIFNIIQGNFDKPEEFILQVSPKSKVSMPLPEEFIIKPESYLVVKIKTQQPVEDTEDKESDEESSEVSESQIGAGDTQDVEIDNVGVIEELYNDPFLPKDYEEGETVKDEGKEGKNTYIGTGNKNIEKYLSSEQKLNEENWTTFTFRLNDYFEDDTVLRNVFFTNSFSDKDLVYTELDIYSNFEEPEEDEPKEEDIQPDGNYKQRSKDAIVRYRGIDIIRESNQIDDIIDGVTLNLKKPTEGEEELEIDHDYEAIKEFMVEYIDYTNLLMTYIYNTTKYDKDKTEKDLLEIYRGNNYSKEEFDMMKFQGEAYERLLYNDRDVYKIKSELRNLLMSPYDTDAGSDISLLIDIGIERDTDYDEQMQLENPLLEVEEDIFVEKLEEDFDSVKQIFYTDTNEDFIVDSGLAYRIYTLMDYYRERRIVMENAVYPGPIYSKVEILRDQNEELEEDLEDAEERVEEEVEEFEQQLIKMNEAQSGGNNQPWLNPGGGSNSGG